MPPKIKITKAEIVDTALNLVREAGEQALNARSIAGELKCSTQPVFSNFETMEDLHEAVKEAAYARYQSYLKADMETWICAHGMATMLATSFVDWDEEFISRVLTDTYEGIKKSYTGGRK